jgi:hypothetical protein
LFYQTLTLHSFLSRGFPLLLKWEALIAPGSNLLHGANNAVHLRACVRVNRDTLPSAERNAAI